MRSATTPPKGGSSSPNRGKPRPAGSQPRRKPSAGSGAGAGKGQGSGKRGAPATRTNRSGGPAASSRTTRTARSTAAPRSGGTGRGKTTASDRDKATFRRRRLVALTIVLVLVAGIAIGVRAGVSALASADDMLPRAISTTPVVPPDPDDAPTGPPTEDELANPVDCRPSAIGLTLNAPGSVKEGATTSIPVAVTNTGQVPCLVDVGARVQLTIYSGDDLVWASQHCSGAGDRRVLLDIDGEDTTSFRWNGKRSASGCPGDQSVAKPGTYRAVVTLVGADGEETLAETEENFTIT